MYQVEEFQKYLADLNGGGYTKQQIQEIAEKSWHMGVDSGILKSIDKLKISQAWANESWKASRNMFRLSLITLAVYILLCLLEISKILK